MATIYNKASVHHLSTSLHLEYFPNIHPMAMLPPVSRIYSAAYSIFLTSAVPWKEIPDVLKSVRRLLMHGATFHLTMIDPMPFATEVGPFFRGWLVKHLVQPLERKRRCTTPLAFFPGLLEENCLWGEGSTTKIGRFYAVARANGGNLEEDEPNFETRALKTELRSEVGRMIWKEVWGPFVEDDGKMWWDYPDIIQECVQMGTWWRYVMFDCVREG
ncbi:hypothetical protein IMZ48_29375 [Candidatus Bathyarchaeota archaeon]|nr:hypothetical protein [Candidatus Bathyarchaeota archaeon]